MKSRAMNDIGSLLERLGELTSLAELAGYTEKYIPGKYHKNQLKYPRIPFQISAEEIQKLKAAGWINKDTNELIPEQFAEADAMTRLLFSIVWKQGDLLKVARIVDGIVDKKASRKSDRITFLEFGRFLRNPQQEVIVDQHVFRAYRVISFYEAEKRLPDPDEQRKMAKKDAIKESDRELVEDFRQWVGETSTFQYLRTEPDWRFAVDDFLFAFGKMVKGEWK